MDKIIEKRLLKEANEALINAYAPYSKVHVAAAVMGEDGSVYTGVNVENASYGLSICAERNAIFKGVSHGINRFKAMVIVSDSQHINSPCGACRQVMAEFSQNMYVVVASPAGYFEYQSKQLLPAAFSINEEEDEEKNERI